MYRLLCITLLLSFTPAQSTRQLLESGWISTCDAAGCYGRAVECRMKTSTKPDGTTSVSICYYPTGF